MCRSHCKEMLCGKDVTNQRENDKNIGMKLKNETPSRLSNDKSNVFPCQFQTYNQLILLIRNLFDPIFVLLAFQIIPAKIATAFQR